ncbi:hypothetical protein HDU76_008657, partial [Blyttiomyces sp. JEL0837]
MVKSSRRSLWDRLPNEIKTQILHFTDILTQFLHRLLTEEQIIILGTSVWNRAFLSNWNGDLSILPSKHLPTIHTGLGNVASTAMYKNLCNLRPDLADLKEIKEVLNDASLWKWSVSPDVLHMRHINREKSIEQNLVHIPLRQCWFEEIQDWLTQDIEKSLVLAASNNHAKFFQRLMEQDRTKEYSNLDRVLSFCFQRVCSNGCVDMVRTMIDMNIVDPSENVNAGLRYAAGAGHLEIVNILVDLDSVMDAGLEEVFQAALNGGNLDIVKLLVED